MWVVGRGGVWRIIERVLSSPASLESFARDLLTGVGARWCGTRDRLPFSYFAVN